jgi:hypothetical protein
MVQVPTVIPENNELSIKGIYLANPATQSHYGKYPTFLGQFQARARGGNSLPISHIRQTPGSSRPVSPRTDFAFDRFFECGKTTSKPTGTKFAPIK